MFNQNSLGFTTKLFFRCYSLVSFWSRRKEWIYSSKFSYNTLRSFYIQHCLSNASNLNNRRICTLIPGTGPGIDLAHSLQDIFFAAHIPVGFETILLADTDNNKSAPFDLTLTSIFRNRLCLKGLLEVRSQEESQNINNKLRKALGLYGKIVHAKSVPFINTRHKNIDILICIEQIHGNYSIIEFEVLKNAIACSKIVSYGSYKNLIEQVFGHIKKNFRKKVHFIHKGNIFKIRDGLFLKACEEVSKNFPHIEYDQVIVDNCARKLVSSPHEFDVIIMPNIYEGIVTNIAAGLVGGPEYMTCVSFSDECFVFEPVRIVLF